MRQIGKTLFVTVFAFFLMGSVLAQDKLDCKGAKASLELAAKNKALVAAFWHDVFVAKNAEAAENFLSPGYIQHTKGIATGLKGFVDYFHQVYQPNPVGEYADWAEGSANYHTDITQNIAEGDLVVVHVHDYGTYDHGKHAGEHFDTRYVDIFRCADGKIVEHWGPED